MPAAKLKPAPPAPEPPQEEAAPVVAENRLPEVISRVELDQGTAMARESPRNLQSFRKELLEAVTMSDDTAAECHYAIPRKEGGITKMIEGASIRFGELVVYAAGNCWVGARILEEEKDYVVVQGMFRDLQKNNIWTAPIRRRIVNKYGQRYSQDMITNTTNAAVSIAQRNAIFKGIPKAIWNEAYKAARQKTVGDAKTLANRRSDALKYLQKEGATQDMVLAVLGVKAVEDIGPNELTILRGIATAIKDGDTTVEEAFKLQGDKPVGVAGAKEMLEKNG